MSKKQKLEETQPPVSFFAKHAEKLGKVSLPKEGDGGDILIEPVDMPKPPTSSTLPPPMTLPQNGEKLQLKRALMIEARFKTLRKDILQPADNANLGMFILNRDVIPKLSDEAYFNDMAMKAISRQTGVKRANPRHDEEDEEEEEDDDGVSGIPLSQHIREHNPAVYDTIKTLMINAAAARQPQSNNNNNDLAKRRVIPLCSRKWNSTMLASPTGYDRPCVCDTNCIALIKYGKILKEFLTPDEVIEAETVGRKPLVQNACLLCIRQMCHLDFEIDRVNERPLSSKYLTQPHRNEVDVEGEYLSTDCIPLISRYLFPMVMNKFETGYIPHIDRSTGVLTLTEGGYKTIAETGFCPGASPRPTPKKTTTTTKTTASGTPRSAAPHAQSSKRG